MAYTRTLEFTRPSTDVSWYKTLANVPTEVEDVITAYKTAGKIIETSVSGEDTTTLTSVIKYVQESDEIAFLSESVIDTFRTERNSYNSTNKITRTYDLDVGRP